MATIEELDELSVEIINSINGEEEEESKENASSPARANERRNSESGDASVVAVPSPKALVEDSDDEDEVKGRIIISCCITIQRFHISGF